jgi:hypothetical protein
MNGSVLVQEPPPTGTFQRRKSFDLNASLSKPLKYKPHTGKLKPVDFLAKSRFLATLAAGSTSSNSSNNETRAVDKSNVFRPILNLNDTVTKGSSPSLTQKRRESIKKVSSLRAEGTANPKELLAEIAKTEGLRKDNEKSSQLIKKLKSEKMKMSKQVSADKNRNLKPAVGNENNAKAAL